MTEKDYNPYWSKKIRKIISECIVRFAKNKKRARFVDKSQIYTLKIKLIHEMLREANPHFILVTRNPYVACYRAASGKALDMRRYSSFMSFEERLDICASHWSNAISCAIEDGNEVDNFIHVKFEDIISCTEELMKKICEFTEIDFSNKMIPSGNDKIPLGTRFENKWYPIRENVNKKYYEEIKNKDVEIIKSHVNSVAKSVGYKVPKKLKIKK